MHFIHLHNLNATISCIYFLYCQWIENNLYIHIQIILLKISPGLQLQYMQHLTVTTIQKRDRLPFDLGVTQAASLGESILYNDTKLEYGPDSVDIVERINLPSSSYSTNRLVT